MALKTTKRIWYGNPVPKDADGKPQKELIYDRRIKNIPAGAAIPKDVDLQDQIAARMISDGHLVDEIPLEVQLALHKEKEEKEALAKEQKASKA